MKLSGKRIVFLVFSIFVLVCIATLVYPTINYLFFYRSIENLRLSFSGFHLTLEGDRVSFSCVLVISNVEPYSGLRLRDLRYTFSFSDVGGLVDLYGGGETFSFVPLDPCSNLTVPISKGPFRLGEAVLNALRDAVADGVINLRIEGCALLFAFIGGFWISFEPWECQVSLVD